MIRDHDRGAGRPTRGAVRGWRLALSVFLVPGLAVAAVGAGDAAVSSLAEYDGCPTSWWPLVAAAGIVALLGLMAYRLLGWGTGAALLWVVPVVALAGFAAAYLLALACGLGG